MRSGGLEVLVKPSKEKPEYHIVSFSGGKDSTAMLLHMVELGMKIDEIIFCDTGLEFPAMYEHIDKVEKYIGRKITRLKAEQSFEYLAFEMPRKNKTEQGDRGWGWASPMNRWCTTEMKNKQKAHYLQSKKKDFDLISYLGIAADEIQRIKRKTNAVKDKKFPLIDWQWTEKDCLNFCKAHGFDWNGLYDIFDRVSCWCCPLQSLHDLRNLYHNFPQLWSKLKEWDGRTHKDFRPDGKGVVDIETRFIREDALEKSQIKIEDLV